jgi:WD40 repeat protein
VVSEETTVHDIAHVKEDTSDLSIWRVDRYLGGHSARINVIAFSNDGGFLASASEDGTVRLWNPTTGKRLGSSKATTQSPPLHSLPTAIQ